MSKMSVHVNNPLNNISELIQDDAEESNTGSREKHLGKSLRKSLVRQ